MGKYITLNASVTNHPEEEIRIVVELTSGKYISKTIKKIEISKIAEL